MGMWCPINFSINTFLQIILFFFVPQKRLQKAFLMLNNENKQGINWKMSVLRYSH